MRLATIPAAFDHEDFIFEVKYDSFRALAQIANGSAQIISRRGNVYRSFPKLAAGLAEALKERSAVL